MRIYATTCLLLSAALGGLIAPPAFAWLERNLYTFDDPDVWRTHARDLPQWQTVLDKHASQRAALLACPADPDACRGRLKSFNRMLEKGAALSPHEKVELVNFYINRNRYDDDFPRRVYDQAGNKVGAFPSHWITLYDFLTGDGDCEDYATSKYFFLRELGFSSEDLRVVVVHSRELGGYHAVLAVRFEDGEVWLLDTDNRIRKRAHTGYRYVYALNEHTLWDHRETDVLARDIRRERRRAAKRAAKAQRRTQNVSAAQHSRIDLTQSRSASGLITVQTEEDRKR